MSKLWAVALGAMVVTAAQADDDRRFYLGADRVDAVFSTSSPQTVFTGSNNANFRQTERSDTKFYRVRLGTDLSESIGIEAHYGFEDTSADVAENTGALDSYLGLYLVPRGVLFELIDIELPLGYSKVEYIEPAGGSADVDGVAFGVNLGLSLTRFLGDEDREDRSWNLRLIGGGMVYQQDSESRFYGYNLGLRAEF